MTTIVRRRAIDRVRREQSHRDREHRCAAIVAVDDTDPGRFLVASAESRNALLALAQLERNQRKVLELAYYHGLTHGQIAVHLGVPVGTVKTRIRAGLTSMRAARWSKTAG